LADRQPKANRAVSHRRRRVRASRDKFAAVTTPSPADPAASAASDAIPIIALGRAAADALAPGARGKVIATFERSFYIETAPAALACVGGAALGLGPLNVLLDASKAHAMVVAKLVAESPVSASAETLAVGPLVFSFAGARRWEPARVAGGAIARARTRLALAAASLPPAGLAALVKVAFLDLAAQRHASAADPLTAAALPAFAALSGWLTAAFATDSRGAIPDVPPTVATLIGLGPGLTPSGDDLVGGTLVALREAGRTAVAEALAAWALPLARRSTGTISFAHLRAAAAGEAAAAIHDVLVALAAGSDEALAAALAGVGGVGHSSGFDALAGIACVLARLP
jgi:hypothetical protein